MLSKLEKKLISDNIELNELYPIEGAQIQKQIIYLQQQVDFLKKHKPSGCKVRRTIRSQSFRKNDAK